MQGGGFHGRRRGQLRWIMPWLQLFQEAVAQKTSFPCQARASTMTPFPQASTLCNAIIEKEDYFFLCHTLTLQLPEWHFCAESVLPRQTGSTVGNVPAASALLPAVGMQGRANRAVPCWPPKTTAVLEASAKGGSCLSAAHIPVPLAHSC